MSDYNPTPVQPEAHPYQKLGGWLLLFVVVDIIYLPIAVALQFGAGGIVGSVRAMLAAGAVDWLTLFAQLFSLYILAMSTARLVMVIKRDARFLRVYELACAGSAVSLLLLFAVFFNVGLDWSDPVVAIVAVFMLFASAISIIIGVLIMYAYYTKSVRVRTYMGSDEYLRLAFFTKKIKGPEPAVPDAAGEQTVGAACQPPATTPDEGGL